jgi:hypothetical protein
VTPAEATRELEMARCELAAARSRFEYESNDVTSEWVRRAQIHYEDMVALAQEWEVPDCPGEEAWT